MIYALGWHKYIRNSYRFKFVKHIFWNYCIVVLSNKLQIYLLANGDKGSYRLYIIHGVFQFCVQIFFICFCCNPWDMIGSYGKRRRMGKTTTCPWRKCVHPRKSTTPPSTTQRFSTSLSPPRSTNKTPPRVL